MFGESVSGVVEFDEVGFSEAPVNGSRRGFLDKLFSVCFAVFETEEEMLLTTVFGTIVGEVTIFEKGM